MRNRNRKKGNSGGSQPQVQQPKTEKPKNADSKPEPQKVENPKPETPKVEERKDYTGPKASRERAEQLNPMAAYAIEKAKEQSAHNARVLNYEGLNWLSKQNAAKASTYGNVSRDEVEEILKRRKNLKHGDISDDDNFRNTLKRND